MRNIVLVVEGQTEEKFVNDVLNPHFEGRAYFKPIIPITSRTKTGTRRGGAPWSGYAALVAGLLMNPGYDRVGVLMDLYGAPTDTPGRIPGGEGPAYALTVTRAVTESFPEPQRSRVRPHVLLHEFETLVLAAIASGATAAAPAASLRKLQAEIVKAGNHVESINGGENTSPSHRIRNVWEDYTKTVDGISLINEAGLPAVLERCPTFAAWLHEITTD